MRKDWLSTIGLGLVCVAAVVASFSTLASLAAVAGWGERASWLLPVCLDALGMVATRVWLSPTAPAAAQAFAKRIALAAIVVSIAGNAAGHLASTGHLSQGLILVVLVGAVPPAGLAAGIHLADLRRKVTVVLDAAPVPAVATLAVWIWRAPSQRVIPGPAKPKAAPKPSRPPAKSVPESGEVDDVLMQRARHIAEEYEKEHGKPPNRDELKPLLKCGTTKATKVAAVLKKEREAA